MLIHCLVCSFDCLIFRQAKYAYRSIAEFVKHVTSYDEEHISRNPFPELHRPPSRILAENQPSEVSPPSVKTKAKQAMDDMKPRPITETDDDNDGSSDVQLYKDNENVVAQQIIDGKVDYAPPETSASSLSLVNGRKVSSSYDIFNINGEVIFIRALQQDIPNVVMLRQRVDVHGRSRPMEPEDHIAALKLPAEQICLIKEAPTIRWLQGQEEWDRKYRREAEKAVARRRKNEEKAKKLIDNAREQGLLLVSDRKPTMLEEQRRASTMTTSSRFKTDGTIQEDRRWGPLDLEDERPPASAIAKRKDTVRIALSGFPAVQIAHSKRFSPKLSRC